jgi:uncharacterized damage-inducible protein DinB
MIPQMAWLERRFTFDLPPGTFPALVERLRGTPARARELVAGLPDHILAKRANGRWAAKEHLGHLVDLESLDTRRLSEFLNHVPVLSGADMENRSTEAADHRRAQVAEIVQKLAAGREALARRFEALTAEQIEAVSLHPRLQQPMRLIDWAYFVAEHDDHHLAQARRAIRQLQSEISPFKS